MISGRAYRTLSEEELQQIQTGQSNESIRSLHVELQGVEKIRWKEWIKQVLGLELPAKHGQDV